MRIVDHIRKVNLITLLQNILIVMIHFFRNIKEQQCSGIIRLLSEDLKSRLVVSGSLILFNKVHHKQYELNDVFILTGFDNLFIYFFKVTRL